MGWKVESVMTPKVLAVRPQTPFKEIVQLMEANRISAVPVVDVTDSDGRVVGIVSEADLMLKEEYAGARRHGMSRSDAEVAAVGRDAAAFMTRPVITIKPGASLAEAARLMHRGGLKRLPVVDEAGRLVGIVSRADLLKAFLRSDESIRKEVEDDLIERTLVLETGTVTIGVVDGVVSLSGELESRSLAGILVRLARGVQGVVDVEDHITYRLDDTHLGPEEPSLATHYSASERP
jgi:CBS domain-containing protein